MATVRRVVQIIERFTGSSESLALVDTRSAYELALKDTDWSQHDRNVTGAYVGDLSRRELTSFAVLSSN